MKAIISALIFKKASSGGNLATFYPTVLNVLSYFTYLLANASFVNVSVIAFDRLLAVSLHLRYQELDTSKRVMIVLVSVWIISCILAFIYISLPKGIEMVAVGIALVGCVLTTVAYARIYKVVKYHQNQIYTLNRLQIAQTREALRQRKSPYNTLFVYVVFLVCNPPFLPSTILYLTNTSEISVLVGQFTSLFLICLNSS